LITHTTFIRGISKILENGTKDPTMDVSKALEGLDKTLRSVPIGLNPLSGMPTPRPEFSRTDETLADIGRSYNVSAAMISRLAA
jgi:hypothetical protein